MKTKTFSLNQESEHRDFNRMYAIEWARKDRSAARCYMDMWREEEETKREFEETGFNELFLPN